MKTKCYDFKTVLDKIEKVIRDTDKKLENEKDTFERLMLESGAIGKIESIVKIARMENKI